MGNNLSNKKDETVIRSLWKEHRSILVLPINANLETLRVLTKKTDGCYHDVGNVVTASKPGERRERLKQALSPLVLPTKTLGNQPCTISGQQGAIAAELLVGEANAASWFQNATSINVSVLDYSIREFPMNKWDEMIQHFHPNLSIMSPGRPEKRDLFIVQKVVLVSQIKITVRYNAPVDLDLELTTLPLKGLEIEPSYDRSTDMAEFTVLSSKNNQRLPIAFSGFKYTYDKFGVRESKETQVQHDSTGASSSHEEDDDGDDDEEDDEEDDEDIAAHDGNMGDFFEDQDWCISLVSDYDPNENEIYPAVQEAEERDPSPGRDASPPPSPRRDLEDID